MIHAISLIATIALIRIPVFNATIHIFPLMESVTNVILTNVLIAIRVEYVHNVKATIYLLIINVHAVNHALTVFLGNAIFA